MKRIRRIVVLGGGSAGLLAAIGLRRHLPGIGVTVVRSSSLGVIGVGEGTAAAVALHGFFGIWGQVSDLGSGVKY